ncbi:unnamed protein product [Echinostoma caproni]|uniref:DUF1785 domain-containing protein n=1 Tax=Echinostoma caproni TaxID=27848 RepID=A0A183AAK9_9TREM|nr:unnamed protein product [Echinostoma caproni]
MGDTIYYQSSHKNMHWIKKLLLQGRYRRQNFTKQSDITLRLTQLLQKWSAQFSFLGQEGVYGPFARIHFGAHVSRATYQVECGSLIDVISSSHMRVSLDFSDVGADQKRTRQTYTRYQTLELEKEFHFNK